MTKAEAKKILKNHTNIQYVLLITGLTIGAACIGIHIATSKVSGDNILLALIGLFFWFVWPFISLGIHHFITQKEYEGCLQVLEPWACNCKYGYEKKHEPNVISCYICEANNPYFS